MKFTRNRYHRRLIPLFIFVFILAIGWIIPQDLKMPVENATRGDYDQHSFWAGPWGESVTHKGVDIFAQQGTNVHPATVGMVVCAGQNRLGGNFVMVLGPKWRLHYYAHLREIKSHPLAFVSQRSVIGTVGNTGDAIGKPYHLHYTIKTIFPYFLRIDRSPQGWKKAYYLNPIPYLNDSFQNSKCPRIAKTCTGPRSLLYAG